MKTPDERRIEEIEHRVRSTICPVFSLDGKHSIEGRITEADFNTLLASHTAWKITAKQALQLANMTVSERERVSDAALDSLAADYIAALDEIDRLRGDRGVPN